MARGRTATVAGLAATAFAAGTPLVFGALRPGYSHARQYISELGERGAPHAALVGLAGFLPTGLLVCLFLGLAAGHFPRRPSTALGVGLLAGVGLAYIGAALFPCDPGCPATGSAGQQIHNSLALLEYGGGAAGLIALARSFRADPAWRPLWAYSLLSGLVVALAPPLLSSPASAGWRGLTQRLAEVAIFGWIAVAGLWCGRAPRPPQRPHAPPLVESR